VRLAAHGGGVDLDALEARAPDTALLHGDVPPAVALLEAHEQGAPRPVLVDRHRLGRAAVGPQRGAGPAALRGVPVAERQVVEVHAATSSLVKTTSSCSVRSGDVERAVDHPDVQVRVVARDIEPARAAARRPLRGEDPAMDHGGQAGQQRGSGRSGVEDERGGPLSAGRPASAARS